MVNLQLRSYQKELLDSEYIPFRDIRQNLIELSSINKRLGGHKVCVKGLKALIQSVSPNQPISVCEIGSGGGDNLLALSKWCNSNNFKVSFTGIDIKTSCIEYAKKNCEDEDIDVSWINSDYLKADLSNRKPTIIFCSLFCHHFSETELNTLLMWMKENSTHGFFINDLHRHPFVYYSIKFITKLFSKSYLVKNDAPLSVAKGFTREEWEKILKTAGIENYTISWHWAFRHLVTYRHG